MKKLLILLVLFLFPFVSSAHPGRTDSAGCHTCRTNCPSWGLSTGEYHCHNAKAIPQPIAPIKSTYGESGTGYTSPAPEYQKGVVPTQASVKPKTETVQKTAHSKPIAPQAILETPVEKKGWVTRFFDWFF
jgi:hypothetical protein